MIPYEGDTEIITNIGTTPDERGLTTGQFKAKFDESMKSFVDWFNSTHLSDSHIPHLGTTTNIGNNYSVTTDEEIEDGSKFSVKFNDAADGEATLEISTDGVPRALIIAGGDDFKPKAGIYSFIRDGINFQLLGEGGGGEYGTAEAGDVLAGKTIGTETGIVTGTMPNQGAKVITPGTSSKTIAAGYHNGSGYVEGDADLVAGNIKDGVSIFGVAGNLTPGSQVASGTATPSAGSPSYEPYVINVSGLDFKPSIVITKKTDVGTTGEKMTMYISTGTHGWGGGTINVKFDYRYSSADSFSTNVANVQMLDDGFRIPTHDAGTVYWIAIE